MSMQILKLGPCGGCGGSPMDANMAGVTHIAGIKIRHGHAVDAMAVLYERNGVEEWTERWGGNGGGPGSEVRLRKDEYIKRVEGHIGMFNGSVVLRSLKFVTNRRELLGPYGREEGMEFILEAADDSKIMGFHGRSGSLLHAIGTYVTKRTD